MSFIASYEMDFETLDYIIGDYHKGMSICTDRYHYLMEMNFNEDIVISMRDPVNKKWAKWVGFPGPLLACDSGKWERDGHLEPVIDLHRGMLSNEIIIESDYPTYEENYEAARIVGEMLEERGFQPLYYFSGNKSVHIHVFLDWNCLKQLDPLIKDQLCIKFLDSIVRFKKKFMEWLREKLITCFDTNIRKFDQDLIRPTHLIRCELSKNKLGYKTFLGYTYNDMSFVPYVCNEQNRIYPKLGAIKLSTPHNIKGLVEEFVSDLAAKTKKAKQRRNQSLLRWDGSPESLRSCIKHILSNSFKECNDGENRGFFILLNELRRVLGDSTARVIINDWNARMDFPMKEFDIEYRFKSKIYTLSCDYIHRFLKGLGIDVKCDGKI